MLRKNNSEPTDSGDANARLVTSEDDKVKAQKWFARGRELGDKRNFDYAIEYYVSGLEFWPDAVEDACKPLHGCAVARKQTGGKKPGLKNTMKRSTSDKDPRKAFVNSLWLFANDPDNISYIEAVTRTASKLRAEDTAKWAAGVYQKALETNPKAGAKNFQALAQLVEEMSDRAAARGEHPVGVATLQIGVDALSTWRRRFPKDQNAETAIKTLSTKLTILKGKYQDGESYRDSIAGAEEQAERHDMKRSVQTDERVDALAAKAEAEWKANPESAGLLKNYIDLLCRRERPEEENKAIGVLVEEYKRTDDYRWKQLADDIRMKQLGREVRDRTKAGDEAEIKKARINQLKFELGAYKDRVDRYPTDLRLRFEYGARKFNAGQFDEAIPLFQAARADPKNRSACGMYLGRCFYRKGYHSQAIATLEEAIRDYEAQDDDLAKNMQYWLGRAQEANENLDAARKTYGNLLQMDYNFRDVRARLDNLQPPAGPAGEE